MRMRAAIGRRNTYFFSSLQCEGHFLQFPLQAAASGVLHLGHTKHVSFGS
jgi:hypothetical protein